MNTDTGSKIDARAVPDGNFAGVVTAIIPTHNRADMLVRAIKSVQRQTYPHLEIIVVDDASTDNTKEVVEGIDDSRIRYVRHETNRGGSAARNTGISAVTGEYVAFLDDDDEWKPEKTAEQLVLLRMFDVVACASDDVHHDVRRRYARRTIELDDLRQGPWGGTGVLMAKSAVLRETMFDESLPRGQDWDIFIRIALKHKIAFLDKPLLRYNSGSHPRITNRARHASIAELERQLRVVEKHRALFGSSWFNRQMSQGLLFGIKDRKDKLAVVTHTARHYGAINVLRALMLRAAMKLRERFHRRN